MSPFHKLLKLLVLIPFLTFPSLLLAQDPLPDPIGRVVWIKGSLKAMMPNKEVRVLQKTSIIYLNDTLTTDANSTAEIVFTDNSLMTFRPNSKFYVDQYAYQPTKKKTVSKFISTLVEGGFRTITGAVAKESPDNYRVNTPVATIGVRGTDYEAVIKDGELAIVYYDGQPCVSAGNKKVCLNNTLPFASVSSDKNAVPKPLKTIPIDFADKSVITPAFLSPFSIPDSLVPNGPITSFCITQ